jgi:hypothetical protein
VNDRRKCIFSCIDKAHAEAFLRGLATLVEAHTCEELIDLETADKIRP